MAELTVGIISVGGETSLRRCLTRLTPQLAGQPVEIVVPYDAAMSGAGTLRAEFPQVEFLDLGVIHTHAPCGTIQARHEVFDRLMSVVMATAQGSIVSLLQDCGVPNPDWCAQVLAAHRSLPHAAIGGGVEHEGAGALNWAVYFQDFGRYQGPITEGPSRDLTDVNIAYKRQALIPINHLWKDRFNEVTVNTALRQRGDVLWQNPAMLVRHDRGSLSLGSVLAERFSWGRIRGAARVYAGSAGRRWLYLVLSPLIPALLVSRIGRKVFGGGRHRKDFLRSLPALTLLVMAWGAGEFWGTLTRRPSPVGDVNQRAEG